MKCFYFSLTSATNSFIIKVLDFGLAVFIFLFFLSIDSYLTYSYLSSKSWTLVWLGLAVFLFFLINRQLSNLLLLYRGMGGLYRDWHQSLGLWHGCLHFFFWSIGNYLTYSSNFLRLRNSLVLLDALGGVWTPYLVHGRALRELPLAIGPMVQWLAVFINGLVQWLDQWLAVFINGFCNGCEFVQLLFLSRIYHITKSIIMIILNDI